MYSQAQISELIELIYAALLGETGWQAFLDRLALTMPDGKAVLFMQGTGAQPIFAALDSGMSEQALAAYGAHFAARNPWIPQMERTAPGLTVTGHRLCLPEILLQSEFYNDFLVPNDVQTSAGIVVERRAEMRLYLTVMSSQTDPAVTEGWATGLAALAPHLRRAAEFYRRTSHAQQLTELGATLFDSMRVGVVIVGAGQQVRQSSEQARRMFGRDIGIDPLGRLRFGSEAARTLLGAMLRLDYDGPRQQSLMVGNLSLTLTRMTGGRESSLFDGPGVCITMAAPGRGGQHHDIGHFAAIYRLTAAETRALDGLLSGQSVDQIARAANRSRETIRSQLKTLYLKTGTNGQADLMRLVAGMRH